MFEISDEEAKKSLRDDPLHERYESLERHAPKLYELISYIRLVDHKVHYRMWVGAHFEGFAVGVALTISGWLIATHL